MQVKKRRTNSGFGWNVAIQKYYLAEKTDPENHLSAWAAIIKDNATAKGSTMKTVTKKAPVKSAAKAPAPVKTESKYVRLGENIRGTVTDEGVLVLRMNLKTELRPSSSGKSVLIASGNKINLGEFFEGFDGIMVGLNLYKFKAKPKGKAKPAADEDDDE